MFTISIQNDQPYDDRSDHAPMSSALMHKYKKAQQQMQKKARTEQNVKASKESYAAIQRRLKKMKAKQAGTPNYGR